MNKKFTIFHQGINFRFYYTARGEKVGGYEKGSVRYNLYNKLKLDYKIFSTEDINLVYDNILIEKFISESSIRNTNE